MKRFWLYCSKFLLLLTVFFTVMFFVASKTQAAETSAFPNTSRSEWVMEWLTQPAYRADGLLYFEYAVYRSQISKDGGDLPFLYNSHKAMVRTTHQKIKKDINGKWLHKSGKKVDPSNLDTFLKTDREAYKWTDTSTNLWTDDKDRKVEAFSFNDYWGRNEYLDPQWERETFIVSQAQQVQELIDSYLKSVEERRLSGDRRGTTIDVQVGAGADDGWTRGVSDYQPTDTNQYAGYLGGAIDSWARFTGISGINSGVTIDVANMQVESNGAQNGSPLTALFAENAAAPVAPTSRADYTGKSLTTAKVDWDGQITFGGDGWSTNHPSIVSVINELKSLTPTVIQIMHKDDGSSTTESNNQRYSVYEINSTLAPKLHIEYTSNSAPTITSATDSPDPVNSGSNVTFTVDWNDTDVGDQVKAHICKTDSISAGACAGGSWVVSSAFTTTDPITLTYTAQDADAGSKSYYAFVCDDDTACSSSTSSTFTVNRLPSAPSSLGGASLVDGSFGSDNTPTLSFTLSDSDSSDTVKYQIQIDDSSDFGSAVVDYTSALAAQGSVSFTVGQAAGSGTYTTGSAGQTLSDSSYYWRVKAIDNSSASSSYSTANSGAIAFKVDATAPTVSVTALSTDPTSDTTPTLSGTATDASSALTAIQFQVDSTSGSWTTCTADDGTIDETSETFTCTTSALSDGSHTIYIRATDSASNTTALASYATDTFTVDATTPTLSLTAISPDPGSDSTPTITGTASDSTGTISNVQFQVDSTSGTWSSCTSDDGSFNEADETFSCTTSALSDGSHTIYVRATDNASNTLSSSQDSFTVDTTAPAALDLKSPENNSYVNVTRPTFKWKTTTDATAGLSKYTLEVDNPQAGSGQASGDFTIDGIPVSRTTDYETTKYLIHYENFSDSDSTNNYISVYTKSSSDWGTSENDGKLRSGTVRWKVKAVDSAGNSVTGSGLVYVDFENPSLTKVNLPDPEVVGAKDGYTVITTTKPSIEGTITDDILPNKILLSFYKQNFFLGIETSQSLELESTHSLTNTNSSASLDFNLTIPQDIAHGKYSVLVVGVDKAGNKSDPKTLSVQIMTLLQARVLLKQTDTEKEAQKDTSIISLPRLEKKAILRREKEASELNKLLVSLNSVSLSIGVNIKQIAQNSAKSLQEGGSYLGSFLSNAGTAIVDTAGTTVNTAVNTVKDTSENINSLANNIQNSIDKNINDVIIDNGKLIGAAVNSTFYRFIDESNKKALSVLNNSQRNVEKQVTNAQAQTLSSARNTIQFVSSVSSTIKNYTVSIFSKTNEALNRSQLASKQQIENTYKGSSEELSRIGNGMKIAFRSLREPVDNSMAFLGRVRVGALTFQSIVLDSNPTRITDVAIEDIGSDFAIVSWKTNHYAWGKVNYGTDLTYGKEVLLDKREKKHTAKLIGLKPGERYYFEVMSQNKNYAYDAFYSFETKE